MTTDAFWLLVKNDLGHRRRTGGAEPKTRRLQAVVWICWICVVATALIAVTVAAARGGFRVEYLLLPTLVFPWVVVGMTHGATQRELKSGTSGWWLALPYSRLELLGAKYVAMLAKAMGIYAVALAVTLAATVFAYAIHGGPSAEHLRPLVTLVLPWYGFLAVSAPGMVAFGLLSAVVMHSRWKPLIPLVWTVYGTAVNSAFAVIFGVRTGALEFITLPSPVIAATMVLGASALLSWVLMALSARLLTADTGL